MNSTQIDAKKQLTDSASDSQQQQTKITILSKELTETIPKLKRAEKENSGLLQDITQRKNALQNLQVNCAYSGGAQRP